MLAAYNPRNCEAEIVTKKNVTHSWPITLTLQVLGQPQLHSEILSQTNQQTLGILPNTFAILKCLTDKI